MVMTPVETIALVTAAIVLIKFLVILKSRRAWYNTIVKRYWKNATITTIFSLAIAIITLFFLLQELTIVQIWATTMFVMALASLSLAPFSKHMANVIEGLYKDRNVLKRGLIAGAVWLFLTIWVLYALLIG
jgi:signal transduction histidine kinase